MAVGGETQQQHSRLSGKNRLLGCGRHFRTGWIIWHSIGNSFSRNSRIAAGLEFIGKHTLTLRFSSSSFFNTDTVISLTGAIMKGTNGESMLFWRAIPRKSGQHSQVAAIEGGVAPHLFREAVKHGFTVP
jgi:allophanate hydrolase subunit 2